MPPASILPLGNFGCILPIVLKGKSTTSRCHLYLNDSHTHCPHAATHWFASIKTCVGGRRDNLNPFVKSLNNISLISFPSSYSSLSWSSSGDSVAPPRWGPVKDSLPPPPRADTQRPQTRVPHEPQHSALHATITLYLALF